MKKLIILIFVISTLGLYAQRDVVGDSLIIYGGGTFLNNITMDTNQIKQLDTATDNNDAVPMWQIANIGSSSVENITAMRALLAVKSTTELTLLRGYYTNGDGGGGYFYWDDTATASDNGGTIIKLTSVATGRYKRIYDNELNTKWFGAKGDNSTDDTDAFQSALDLAGEVNEVVLQFTAYNNAVLVPSGIYVIDSLVLPRGVHLKGESQFSTLLLQSTGSTASRFIGTDTTQHNRNTGISDISIKANDIATTTGVYFHEANFESFMERVSVSYFTVNVHLYDSWTFNMTECRIEDATETNMIGDNVTAAYFEGCRFDNAGGHNIILSHTVLNNGASVFNACAIQQAGMSGVWLDSILSVSFIGNFFESNNGLGGYADIDGGGFDNTIINSSSNYFAQGGSANCAGIRLRDGLIINSTDDVFKSTNRLYAIHIPDTSTVKNVNMTNATCFLDPPIYYPSTTNINVLGSYIDGNSQTDFVFNDDGQVSFGDTAYSANDGFYVKLYNNNDFRIATNGGHARLIIDAPADRFSEIQFDHDHVRTASLGLIDTDFSNGGDFFIGGDEGGISPFLRIGVDTNIYASNDIIATGDVEGRHIGGGVGPFVGVEFEAQSSVPRLRLTDTDGSAFQIKSDANIFTISDLTYYPFSIEATAPTNSLYIHDDGMIGIGTNTPTSQLEVEGDFVTLNSSSTSNSGYQLNNSTGHNYRVLTTGSGHSWGADRFVIYESTVFLPRLTIYGGDVGIGTTDPVTKLTVNGAINGNKLLSSTSPTALFAEGGTETYGQIYLNTNVINRTLKIQTETDGFSFDAFTTNTGAALNMNFKVGGTSAMFLKSDGNVGIGTTSPDALLEISVAASGTGVHIDGESDLYTDLDRSAINRRNTIRFQTAGVDDWGIGVADNDQLSPGTAFYFTPDGPHANNAVVVIEKGGNVGIGTTTPGQTLEITGDLFASGIFYDSDEDAGTSGQILSSTATATNWINGVEEIDDLTDGITDASSVFLGSSSGIADDGSNFNTGVGISVLNANTSGTHNTAMGVNSLNDNIAGLYNTAIGANSIDAHTSGSYNTGLGGLSSAYITTGSNNTAIGYSAGKEAIKASAVNLTSATSCTYLGYQTYGSANGVTNETVMGANAEANGANTVTLGDDNVTDIYIGEDGQADINCDYVHKTSAIHLFHYYGDSTISLSYTTSWQHLTNTFNDMWIDVENDGFTISNDTITVTNAGDYDFRANNTHDGDNGETISIRFYNVTQAVGIPVAGASTTRAANNFMTTPTEGYQDIDAGDKIVLQYKGDASGTAVFKNGIIKIYLIHY